MESPDDLDQSQCLCPRCRIEVDEDATQCPACGALFPAMSSRTGLNTHGGNDALRWLTLAAAIAIAATAVLTRLGELLTGGR